MSRVTWTISNFSSLPSEPIDSDQFVVDGIKWHLRAYPKGKCKTTHMALYLLLADSNSLSPEHKRQIHYRFIVVNTCFGHRSLVKGTSFLPLLASAADHKCAAMNELFFAERTSWFSMNSSSHGVQSMCRLDDICGMGSGFLVHCKLRIVAEIKNLETTGTSHVHEETSTIRESVELRGFELLPSQLEYVSNLLDRYPGIESEFPINNLNLRTPYMNFLLSLVETFCRSPHISAADWEEAHATLQHMTAAGFKLEWLEKKMMEISENKKKVKAAETRIEEIREELRDLQKSCLEVEAQIEMEKEKLSAAKAYLVFPEDM